ncbi:MAG: GDP-L-fucose synthase [Planctomycetota bacterium]
MAPESRFEQSRIAITGGTGFLGAHVVRELERHAYRRLMVVRHADFDLTREADVARMYAELRPDVVIHLAANVGGIGANQKNPGRYFYANLKMGLELIEQGRQHGVTKLVIAGTVCAYPKHAPVPFRELDLWNGYPEETNAPYGIAKKALLVQAQAYREQYGLDAIYLLPVNLYGPHDNFDLDSSHVIPALIRKIDQAMQRGERVVKLWGTGQATREFLYVEDAANAMRLALERYDGKEPVNLGSGEEIRIDELAELIGRLSGFSGRFEYDPARPDGQPRRRLDTTRAREWLGFVPTVGLEEGLRRTIAFYRQARA